MAGKRNKAAKQINQVKPPFKRLFSGNDAENYDMPPEPADDGVSSHSDDGSSNGDADSKPKLPLQHDHDSDNDDNNNAEETLSDSSEDTLANEIKDLNINLDLAEKATSPVSKMPKLTGFMVKGRKTYKIMIGEAIESIGNKKGSSLVTIHKWIMANYGMEKPDKLRMYMKRAIVSGIADGTMFHPGDNNSMLNLSNAKGASNKMPPPNAGSTSPDQQKATKTAVQPEKKRLRPKKMASLEMSKPALLKMQRDKARRKAKKSADEENKENTSPPVHLLRKSTKKQYK